MSTPSYMSKIAVVASQCHTGHLTQKLQVSWMRIERLAQARGYDVLRSCAPSELREEIRLMIGLLYQVPGAETPEQDCAQLVEKNAEYGGSWHRRGGPGAFFMLSRKWDRLEQQLANHQGNLHAALKKQTSEQLSDTLGDLRRYLILVEAWHVATESTEENTDGDIPF